MIDSRRKENTKDRILAFRFAFCLWQPYSTQWICWFGLLRAQLAHPELRGFFWKYTWQHLTAPTGRFWMHYVQWRLLSMRWWKHHEYKFHRIWHWIRDQCLFHRHLFRLYSGKAIQLLGHLSREAAGNPDSPRWAAEDWSKLRKKRGPLIAWATCHGCKTAWLSHTPLLPYEKPNPNDTSYATIVGLCGLQLLWREGEINFAALSEEDAERAARYALCEINCFSDWFPDLTHAQSHVVRRVMQACIQGEWQFPPERTHGQEILYKLLWQGESYWPLIAGDLFAQLQIEDPQHPQIFNYAISILLRSSNPPLWELAALAAQRVTGYLPDSPFFISWLMLWLQLNALEALVYLKISLDGLPLTQADDLMLRVCDALRGDRIQKNPHLKEPDYLHPHALRSLVPLVSNHIRPKEDINRSGGGAYSPTLRDHAQEFRDGLLQRLAQIDNQEVPAILKELRNIPALETRRDWITHLIEQHMSEKVDLSPWHAEDIQTFATEFETDPRSDTDLFCIARWRMQDIKREVECSENSLRDEVHKDWDEAALRRWLKRKLEERSRHRYTVPQEAEIDQKLKADLRFENPRIRAAVPVEIKWADKNNWPARVLLERLENQLVGQYMRAQNIRYGIYLLGYIGRKKSWDHPTEERRHINFAELVHLIKQRAQEIEKERPDIAEICVISLDFTIS